MASEKELKKKFINQEINNLFMKGKFTRLFYKMAKCAR
jgi:hypothetical protein